MKDLTVISIINFRLDHNCFLISSDLEYRHADDIVRIRDIISPVMGEGLGSGFIKGLLDTPYFIAKEDFLDSYDFKANSRNYGQLIDSIFQSLWFVRDNACNVDRSYSYSSTLKQFSTFSQHKAYSKADGCFPEMTFSVQEINQAIQYLEKFLSLSPSLSPKNQEEDSRIRHIGSTSLTQVDYNDFNRIQRAFNFLNTARCAPQLAMKISFYVLILECFFSDNELGEIQHRIGERVALYMGEDYDQRNMLYDNIKKYYAIRSKYVHGQKLDNKYGSNQTLKEVSVELDELVRRIFIKVLTIDSTNFLLDGRDFTKWFKSILFRKDITDNITEIA